ncbi:protein of unknown function (plasmid) [Streptantibioticus cattleyicolor NRRL 8057 = DSM 46488]|nr:protein of unknown function [Streptantibioticus cattleyicolor NRRL 8057 = DSM 46488]
MGAVRRERRRRQDHGHRRWRLPGHRPGHPAPPREGPDRTPGMEGGAQRLPPQSPRPCRARLRPDEGLEDPSRLPAEGRRRPARHARHRPPAQPRPCRVTQKPAGHQTRQRSFTGQPLGKHHLISNTAERERKRNREGRQDSWRHEADAVDRRASQRYPGGVMMKLPATEQADRTRATGSMAERHNQEPANTVPKPPTGASPRPTAMTSRQQLPRLRFAQLLWRAARSARQGHNRVMGSRGITR